MGAAHGLDSQTPPWPSCTPCVTCWRICTASAVGFQRPVQLIAIVIFINGGQRVRWALIGAGDTTYRKQRFWFIQKPLIYSQGYRVAPASNNNMTVTFIKHSQLFVIIITTKFGNLKILFYFTITSFMFSWTWIIVWASIKWKTLSHVLPMHHLGTDTNELSRFVDGFLRYKCQP